MHVYLICITTAKLSKLQCMLSALVKDKLFLTTLLGAFVFYALLYINGMRLAALDWPMYQFRQFLVLALLAPIIEELVFRGMLQSWLLRFKPLQYQKAGVTVANIVVSLIFTLLHFWQHPPLWAVSVFIPSLLFGFFRDRYNHVIPAILLHCFYNLSYFWLFYTN